MRVFRDEEWAEITVVQKLMPDLSAWSIFVANLGCVMVLATIRQRLPAISKNCHLKVCGNIEC